MPDRARPSRRRWLLLADRATLAGIAVAAVGLRFATKSPLWLDEALSANIAHLPLADIPRALRHDGHPPLYYVLLHFWMEIFGTSAVAVRALSGVFGLALFPLIWKAGERLGSRRVAFAAVLALALSPYAIRYSTETRMYSLVMVLALAAWLVAGSALEHPTWPRLIGLVLLSTVLLWSHYWAMWLLGTAAIALVVHGWRLHRAGRTEDRHASLRVLGALIAGGVLFLPWAPSLLYQSAHTGTPWAGPVRPTEVVAQSVVDLGGGPAGEAVLLGILLVILVVLALLGHSLDARHIELDLTTRPEARPLLVIVGGTFAFGSVVSYATGSAFATRYIAVVVPLILLTVGLGLSRFTGAVAFRVVAASVLLLGAAGAVRNVTTDRTQAGATAAAYRAEARPDDLVVVCPDQLGPALSRELPARAEVVTYPDFGSPRLVDWVDYDDRLAKVNPKAFAARALRRAGPRTIWYAWSGSYKTHKGTCEMVLNTMLQARPWATTALVEDGERYFEHEALWRLPARKGG